MCSSRSPINPYLHKSFWTGLGLLASVALLPAAPPNIILIMTDDQGYGDFGVTGNPIINTPHLDQLARESATMTDFYVSPVCSPTRANLLTGRYNYRTGVVDTFKGRSMMYSSEVTIAEVLRDNGYATGIFGKWHLGDNYPLRPTDQGFQETYVHLGGGLGQPSEPIENQRRYTNPILFHNNQKVETRGYCTDLYFEAATRFIDQSLAQRKPFFAYIPTNAPHSPYHDVPEALYQKYRRMDLTPIMVDEAVSADDVARIFAMIENVDENVGRLMDHLERKAAAENTIVIFLTDNGPNSRRFVGPFRGRKNEVHEGGVRTPLWIRWPARLKAGESNDRVSAHYDIMPTLLEAVGIAVPEEVALDGRSLLKLLEGKSMDWPDRDIFIQAHRGNEPVPRHHMLMRNQRWKLLRASGFGNETPPAGTPFELYDMENDQGETNNLAEQRPEIVEAMLQRYQTWFEDVSSTRPENYAPPRMHLHATLNPELILNSQDRRELADGYEWHIALDQPGTYEIELEWAEPSSPQEVNLTLDSISVAAKIGEGMKTYRTRLSHLPAGPLNLVMRISSAKNRPQPPYFVKIRML